MIDDFLTMRLVATPLVNPPQQAPSSTSGTGQLAGGGEKKL